MVAASDRVAGSPACLEPTSPGTRPPPAPRLLDVTSYAIDLDLTTGSDDADLRLDHHDRVHLPRARRRDLRRPGRRDHPRDHAQRRAGRRLGVRRQPDRADRPGRREHPRGPGRLHLLPHRRGPAPLRRPRRRPGLPLLPVRGPGRPPRLHHLRAARPQGAVHLHRDRAGALEGRLQRRRRPQPEDREPTGRRERGLELPADQADVDVRHRAGRRRVPRGPATPTTASTARSRWATTAGSRWSSTSTPTSSRGHRAGLRVLRGGLRLPLPVRQVRPAVRAGVQHGRDGERRLRDVPRRVPPAQPPGPLVLRVPRRGDPPRDGAHVVRRPRDHAVVGRPLAQRVVRRVGLLPRGRRGDRVHRGLDRLHQRPQELGLPPGPAAQHPPDRRRQLRPAGRRGELRRHHLRQGRLGAQAAGRLGRPGELPRRAPRLLPGPRVRQHRVQGPAGGAGEGLAAASWSRGRRSGCRPRASTRWPPSSSSTTTAATPRSRSARPPPPTTRRCAGTGSASASTTRSTAGWSGVPRSRPTSTASCTEVAELVGQQQPDLLLLNDGDLAYAKIRLDERSLATRGRPASRPSTTRWPGRCAGAPRGT